VTFSIGIQQRLENGALFKAKVGPGGLLVQAGPCRTPPRRQLGARPGAQPRARLERARSNPARSNPARSNATPPPQVNHLGVAALLYEQRLASGERLALSTQLDTVNVGSKAPKVGVALDLA
jgi:hypothetical protein